MADEALREELIVLTARLEAVEVGRRRDPEMGDVSEEEVEVAADVPEGESAEVKLLKSVLLSNSRPKPELPTYDGSLSIDDVLDWISEMDKYFECEEVSEDRRVKFAATKLKGHVALWWDSVHSERKRLNKTPIKTWTRMVAKLKGRFLPRDYQIAIHRQQSAIKSEEKINRRQNARRGRGSARGRGQSYGRGQTASNSEEASSSRTSGTTKKGDGVRGGRSFHRDRGNGRGRGIGYQCYRCHKWGHRSFECPETDSAGHGSMDNLVSTEMVEKLGLKRLKHPSQYRVSWLQQAHQLLVDEQSKVEFQIGRYKDKIICDIMPMDVCHILLGRPSQYDRKVTHDGVMNCYKFEKDGVRHTLVPIKEEKETAKTTETKALLVSRKQFLKQVENSEIGYAVVKKTRTVLLHTEITDLPMEIQ
eukprot:PITA_09391